jgi:hypothetical protein
MKIIKATYDHEIPKNFTGIIEYEGGEKYWYKNGKLHREDGPAIDYLDKEKLWYKEGERHREDGPAIEYPNGVSYFYFEDKGYNEINLKDYVVLDHYKGKNNFMWYKLLGEDKVIEYPDIPGLIIK